MGIGVREPELFRTDVHYTQYTHNYNGAQTHKLYFKTFNTR